MLKTSIISAIIFLLFNSYGIAVQISDILKKSNSGEMAGILNSSQFFSSSLPLYLLQFSVVVIALIATFILSNAYFSILFSKYLKNEIKSPIIAKSTWLILSNISLMILNAAYFKHSNHLTEFFRIWPENHLNIYILWFILITPIICFMWSVKTLKLPLILIIMVIGYFNYPSNSTEVTNDNQQKPNIIVIGIDSLRSDLLQSHMPFLTSQLQDSTVFPTTFTPLARTFPAWNTILSGLYPINHGARINLIPNNQLIKSEKYLPSILNKEGYHTTFAIDETRFANIGKHQGFDQTITPRVGASDFIISSIADLPLINLLSLNQISQWLLPELYANRGAAKIYRSNSFSKLLENEITITSKPTFLAVHFCLAHWPFIFSTKMTPTLDHPEPYYPINLRAIDHQIKALFNILEKKGLLQNSRIIFLSDHGEAWAEESISYSSSSEETFFRKEYGHGSSITSHSNQVLLAFKGFSNLKKNTMNTASLADIAPTLLNELNIQHNYPFDGIDLQKEHVPEDRFFPIESGTTLNINETDDIDVDSIVNKFLDRYELNTDGLLSIRKDKIQEGLNAKIYGIRNKKFVLEATNKKGFMLFNQTNHTFQSFKNFEELKSKVPIWANEWCSVYKEEREECKASQNNSNKVNM